jgi:hypothetical protein
MEQMTNSLREILMSIKRRYNNMQDKENLVLQLNDKLKNMSDPLISTLEPQLKATVGQNFKNADAADIKNAIKNIYYPKFRELQSEVLSYDDNKREKQIVQRDEKTSDIFKNTYTDKDCKDKLSENFEKMNNLVNIGYITVDDNNDPKIQHLVNEYDYNKTMTLLRRLSYKYKTDFDTVYKDRENFKEKFDKLIKLDNKCVFFDNRNNHDDIKYNDPTTYMTECKKVAADVKSKIDKIIKEKNDYREDIKKYKSFYIIQKFIKDLIVENNEKVFSMFKPETDISYNFYSNNSIMRLFNLLEGHIFDSKTFTTTVQKLLNNFIEKKEDQSVDRVINNSIKGIYKELPENIYDNLKKNILSDYSDEYKNYTVSFEKSFHKLLIHWYGIYRIHTIRFLNDKVRSYNKKISGSENPIEENYVVEHIIHPNKSGLFQFYNRIYELSNIINDGMTDTAELIQYIQNIIGNYIELYKLTIYYNNNDETLFEIGYMNIIRKLLYDKILGVHEEYTNKIDKKTNKNKFNEEFKKLNKSYDITEYITRTLNRNNIACVIDQDIKKTEILNLIIDDINSSIKKYDISGADRINYIKLSGLTGGAKYNTTILGSNLFIKKSRDMKFLYELEKFKYYFYKYYDEYKKFLIECELYFFYYNKLHEKEISILNSGTIVRYVSMIDINKKQKDIKVIYDEFINEKKKYDPIIIIYYLSHRALKFCIDSYRELFELGIIDNTYKHLDLYMCSDNIRNIIRLIL